MQKIQKKALWKALIVAGAMVAAGTACAADALVRFSNKETIAESDLTAFLSKRLDLKSAARNAWGVETVLKEMALTRALNLEGEALKVERPPERAKERFDEVYAYAVHKKISPACDAPADAVAARKYFDDHPEAFKVPPMARLSRVMLPVSESMGGEGAGGWLLMQVQAIGAKQTTFEEVAKKAEAVYKLEVQGDLGWVTLVDDNSILRLLTGVNPGEIMGPVREGDFSYIFMVKDKRESRQLAWEEIAVSAGKRAVTFCRQEANKKIEADLFKKYGVEVDQAAVKALFNKTAAAK